MRPTVRVTPRFFLPLFGLLILVGCSTEESPSLFDPSTTYPPDPTISSVSPPGSAYAGMDTLVLTGTNYSSVLANNFVYFNGKAAALLTATTTQITLVPPLVVGDSIEVKVSVSGALLFSNIVQYELKAGVTAFGQFTDTEHSTSLATDATGNLYAGFTSSGVEGGILMFTPAGVRSTYGLPTGGVTLWTGLKMGPSGYLFAARTFRALYAYPPGGGTSAALWSAFPIGTSLGDFDFDQNGNLWSGGAGASFYRVKQDKTIKTFPFSGTVHSVRVYGSNVYFAAYTTAGGEQIWSAPLIGDSLGTPAVYFDFGAVYPNSTPQAITFSSDGVLYIGTDTPEAIVVVQPNKTYLAPFQAYGDLIGTAVRFLAWGASDDLYASTMEGVVLKFDMRGKTGAPYHGTTL